MAVISSIKKNRFAILFFCCFTGDRYILYNVGEMPLELAIFTDV